MNHKPVVSRQSTRCTLYDASQNSESHFERLCAHLMILLLGMKCGGEARADRRLAGRRNLIDVVQVHALGLDLCSIVGKGTGLADREQQASVACAYKDTAQLAAFSETLRWLPFCAYLRVAFERAFRVTPEAIEKLAA